jgi:hypothetical protein
MKTIVKVYEDFLANYSLTKEQLSKINYDKYTYPLRDALFDRIMFNGFCEHLHNTGEFQIWVDFNEEMDKEGDTSKADRIWNKLCRMTNVKIKELLK